MLLFLGDMINAIRPMKQLTRPHLEVGSRSRSPEEFAGRTRRRQVKCRPAESSETRDLAPSWPTLHRTVLCEIIWYCIKK